MGSGVTKSTKEIIRTVKSKENSIWEKTKKILTEIAVIVFSVSLSIGLHSWSGANHNQDEVESFLVGLRNDLKKDRNEMLSDMQAYQAQKKAFTYIVEMPKGQQANSDSIKLHLPAMKSFTGFLGNSGRYEGFKSSGKIAFIKDDDLQNNILDYYEETIPILTRGTDFYKIEKQKLNEFIIDKTNGFPAGNFAQVLSSGPVRNRSMLYLSSVDSIIKNYENCISKIDGITELIDKKYPQKKQ